MLRIFLAVEGTNDGGALGRSPTARANDPDFEGALQPLVRHIIDRSVEIVGVSTSSMFLGGLPDPKDAPGCRARKAAALAAYDGCDILVLHCDVDDTEPLHDPAEATAAMRRKLNAGFALAASDDGHSGVRCVAAVPCRTIESWLLADHAAVRQQATGANCPEQSVERPELLWGPNARGTDHPKHVFRRALDVARPRAATRDYRAVAETSDPQVLETRCPDSFLPFRVELRAACG